MSHSIDPTQVPETTTSSNEVNPSPRKRRYSVAFKLRLIEEADRCINEPGELAALLRREGIYFSTLGDFRKQKAKGLLDSKRTKALPSTPKERTDPKVVAELAASEREVRRLKRELERARALLDLQKKVSELLGLSWEPTD